ncbi:unnamed protein product, partial [marine sediment metagenome]
IENLMPGTVPYVDTILPGNWSKNEVFYPLVGGIAALGAGLLTDAEYSNFLLGLGTTATISAILKATLTPIPAARFAPKARLTQAQQQRMAAAVRARAATQQRASGVSTQEAKVGNMAGSQLTPTGIPTNILLS